MLTMPLPPNCHSSISLVLIVMFATGITILAQDGSINPCINVSPMMCGKCLAAGPDCGWCLQEDFSPQSHRCDLISNLVGPDKCHNSSIIQDDNNIEYFRNDPPRNEEPNQPAIQLSPQIIKVKLRPNKPFKFNVNFRQAENYPVDLYYIMDLSMSMADDVQTLARLGNDLASEMRTITQNFRLGFGSFVDKITTPYVDTRPQKLQEPCKLNVTNIPCVKPYGYRHSLDLTTNTGEFQILLNKTRVSGNLDTPEGGMDAVMQAISCQAIGWRDASRKMVLFSTDADFHLAGDGKLGGIVTPNDGECHLDSKGEYTESLEQDYPSVSQLVQKIKEKNVNVIFAVTADQVKLYERLSNFIEASAVGALANDSSNIVRLVRENYLNISSNVTLVREGGEEIQVHFRSSCLGDEMRDVSSCGGLGVGKNVTYEVSLGVQECPADKSKWKQSLFIYPAGLNERLTIDVELICECDCELPQNEERNSDKCGGHSTYECGACTCSDGYYGKFCQCDLSKVSAADYEASCRRTNSSQPCEGHGTCECGECVCNPIIPSDPTKKYRGIYCECNDYSCHYSDFKLCGGPQRGSCLCGVCNCTAGYTGIDCGCPTDQKGCIASNGKLCNDEGTCYCGSCVCNPNSQYRGPKCEDCPSCTTVCDEYKACVLCKVFPDGKNRMPPENCTALCENIVAVDVVQDEPDKKTFCKRRDESDNCDYLFTYEYNTKIVHAQKTKECPVPVNVLAIVLGVIGAILLIGLLLLLLWKLFVTLHDQREVAKFEKEKEKAKWDMDENPLYKQATTTFNNPTYASK